MADFNSIASSSEFVSSMAGAFAGALAAFLLNAIYEFKKTRDTKHAAIIQAQYAICSQINDLENLKKQQLEPVKDHPHRELRLPRLLYPFTNLRVNTEGLVFFATGQHANELNEILMAQGCYLNVLGCLDEFNRCKKEIEDMAEFVSAKPGSNIATIRVESTKVGKFFELRISASNIYETNENALKKLHAALSILARVGKTELMERNFLKLEEPSSPVKDSTRKAI